MFLTLTNFWIFVSHVHAIHDTVAQKRHVDAVSKYRTLEFPWLTGYYEKIILVLINRL